MNILIFILILCLFGDGAFSCEQSQNSKCIYNGTEVFCAGVSDMPCFTTSGLTSLTIRDSPTYTKLYEDDIPIDSRNTLIDVTFINVGFEKIDNDAFHDMYNLENLVISQCKHFNELDFDSNTAPQFLKTLDLSEDTELRDIDGFKHLQLLEELNMTRCDLRKIYENTLDELSKMRILTLKDNTNLEWISRYAFTDMYNLQVLNFDNSRMSSIYPQYFEESWERGSLKEVKGKGSFYKCDNMCDFSIWINDNPGFKNISNLGTCSYDGKEYMIVTLDEDNAGCGLSGWAIFGIVVACLVFGGAVAGAIAWWFMKRRK